MNKLDSLTGIYPLAKTMGFKLIPIGKTDEMIRKGGLLHADMELEENFSKLKKLADDFHKDFINEILTDFMFKLRSTGSGDSLDEYVILYDSDRKANTENQKLFEQVQDSLRLQLAEAFAADSRFKFLDKKELVTEFLSNRVEGEDKELLKKFTGFTSYLQRYNKSRMAIYSGDTLSYSIPSRVVTDNLAIFYANIKRWNQIREILGEEILLKVYQDFEPYLNVVSLDEIFVIDEFDKFLTQKQIDVYNAVLNGFSTETGMIVGINHYIHRYNQQRAEKQKKVAPLQKLKKQILSETLKLSWSDSNYSTAVDMMKDIQSFHKLYKEEIADDLRKLMMSISSYDTSAIYIRNNEGLKNISLRMYGRWDAIQNELVQSYKGAVKPQKRKESDTDFYKRVLKHVNDIKSFSIQELNRCMFAEGKTIQTYFEQLGTYDIRNSQLINHFSKIDNAWTDLYPLTVRVVNQNIDKLQNANDTLLLKNYLDEMMQLLHFIKPLRGNGDEVDCDLFFYEKFTAYYEQIQELVKLYNKCRNFITHKPYSTQKVKLNFGSPVLLSGWSRDKERVNRSCILRKDNKYFLAILDKSGLDAFNNLPECKQGGYEKMYYDLFGDASKMLPKIAFAGCNADLYNPSEEILRIRKIGSYKAGSTFKLEDLHTLIDFYKECMKKNPKWSHVQWPWKPTSEYTSIKQFTDDFTGYDYTIEFKSISEEYVHQLVDEGKIYLFQIYNKDFSPYSKGTKQLYTMYFQMLFDAANLEKVVYKLSGGAEMFFRPASLKPSYPTHPAGHPIENKRPTKDGKPTTRTFKYDLIKDKRYTQDQYILHLPISVNYFRPEVKGMPVTAKVKQLIREGAFQHVIGIHRGEKNLLYVSVLDMKGRIVEQQSLNVIRSKFNDNVIETDYNELLQRRSDERLQARKDWQMIENIKNVKEGYLSQAVSKITDMVLQYNALIVMESLDDKFKKSRQKIEKNVYQKFEQQLVDKLSYLVKKDRQPDQPGGLLKAYQLTDKIEGTSFQNGIIFYVPAAFTASVCPATGFISFFQLKYDNMENVKAFFGKFDAIRYNIQKDHFEFDFNYAKFTDKAKDSREQWTICTHGQRIYNSFENGKYHSEVVNLTSELKRLFVTHNIDFKGNILNAIQNIGKRSFYEKLVELFNLTVQIRNVSGKLDEDYIISPVADASGKFFCSDVQNAQMPVDTDANAAFNIARKGLLVVGRVQSSEPGAKIKMGISNVDWFNYIQK